MQDFDTAIRRLRTVAGAVRRKIKAARGGPAAGRNGSPALGMVEQFRYGGIDGWVMAPKSAFPVRVALHVNEMEVASTWANLPSKHNTDSAVFAFHFTVRDLWDYTKRRDRVTVRLDGIPLPIAEKGLFKRPGRDGDYSLSDLQAKFDAGYLFSSNGRLQLSKKLDERWQRQVIDLYTRVSEAVSDRFGYEPFVVYGTLLGLVREGGFIGHDFDFDCAYVSRATVGREAAAELRDIALALVEAGFSVECKRTALHVHDEKDHDVRIDLFDLFFNDKGLLSFPFGVAGTTEITRAQWTGTREAELGGRTVRIPQNAEEMVEHIYGASWRTPIAGFSWRLARTKRAREAWTPVEYSEEVYWANFYARNELTTGSTFFDTVAARTDLPASVIDIGCGDGRDSFAFARAGRTVLGVDRSHIAIEHASKKAQDAGFEARLNFSPVDVSDRAAVQDAISRLRKAADGQPVLFYMRFFLHSIPEDVQETLLEEIASAALPGDAFAAEFRTDKDAEKTKVYGNHYRRYQNGKLFGLRLQSEYGFTPIDEVESDGLSPFGEEDPVLYRVIAAKK